MPRTGDISVKYEDGEICIRFPIDELCSAILDGRIGTSDEPPDDIFNRDLLAGDVVKQLQVDDEEGSTGIHRLFDDVVDELVANGNEHIEYRGD